MKIEDIPIDKIHVEDRFRQDMGDLEALAANIREMGLLQPIAVDRYYHLIFGARRLEACEMLKWDRIPCVVLELDSILAGEYAENEFRKQFTPSERAAIGKAIEEELGNRHGQRTDLRPKGRESGPWVEGKNWDTGESRKLAAQRAGFGSHQTFERAKTVTERGVPELQAAMDSGAVSISGAAKIASQPKDEQQRILQLPKDEQREVVRQIRQTKADREQIEARAKDIRLFRGLYDAVKFIAEFHEDPAETWAGLWRVSAYDFSDRLERALEYLPRLRKARPNEPKKPVKVS